MVRRVVRRAALLVAVVLAAPVLGACASDGPTRSTLPDRPEVHRPEGVEPTGLRDVRDGLAAQRADTRATMDTALIHPVPLSETPNETGWFGRALGAVLDGAVEAARLRFLGLW